MAALFEGTAQRGALKLQRTIRAGDKSDGTSAGACSRYLDSEPARVKPTAAQLSEREREDLEDWRTASPDTA